MWPAIEQVAARQHRARLRQQMIGERRALGQRRLEVAALAARRRPSRRRPCRASRPCPAAGHVGRRIVVEGLGGIVDVERRVVARAPSSPASASVGSPALAAAIVGLGDRGRRPPRRRRSRCSGFFSSSSAMNASISRLDSASSLIACWSCGVITSDCDWRRSRRGPRPMRRSARYSAKPSPR